MTRSISEKNRIQIGKQAACNWINHRQFKAQGTFVSVKSSFSFFLFHRERT